MNIQAVPLKDSTVSSFWLLFTNKGGSSKVAFPHRGWFLTVPTDMCICSFPMLSRHLSDVPFKLHWKFEVCLFADINDCEAFLKFSLGLGCNLNPARDTEAGLGYGQAPLVPSSSVTWETKSGLLVLES